MNEPRKAKAKHLRDLDIGLLLAFEAVLQERNITRAAGRLGLSQSALSGAVARLRILFGDTLFIRTSEGMNPSRAAIELYPAIKEALDILRTAIDPSNRFDPSSPYTLTVGMSEYASAVVLPRLISHIRTKYPNFVLHIESLPPSRITRLLEEGKVELAISLQPAMNNNLIIRHILDETFVVVMCRSNPLASTRLSLNRYVNARHLLVAPDGLNSSWHLVDDKLAELGASRTVSASSQSYLLSLLSLSGTDLIMTTPTRVARLYARKFGLVLRKPPFEVGSFPVGLVWHRRSNLQPAVSWLRQEIMRVIEGI